MRLIHYSAQPFEFDRKHKYESSGPYKPLGFWVSVQGENDWPAWCLAEDFGTQGLAVWNEVILRPDASVLAITNLAEFSAFERAYLVPSDLPFRYNEVAWERVASDGYDGLIIAPYQWPRRMDAMWYYGWDCASGCIWNLDAIESVTVLKAAAA